MVRNLPNFFKDPHLIAELPNHEPILLALSGGADSSALLHLLCRLREDHNFPLYASHVNHGIRGENYGNEAERDEQFCKDLCASLGVELFSCRIDVPALAQSEGKSLETAAREARYAFLEKIMREKNIKILATAHNADDNLETQIFNLCRGCGAAGMIGVPEKRDFNGIGHVVRPILSASKSEVLDFCKVNEIPYVVDSTNLEDDCTRNRLRHIVIPELKALFGSPEKTSLRLSRLVREDEELMVREASAIVDAQYPNIDTATLASAPSALAKRIIMLAYKRSFSASLEAVHVEDILRFIRGGDKKNGRISLPGRSAAIIQDGKLNFGEDSREQESFEYSFPLTEGLSVIDGTPFAISLGNATPARSINLGNETYSLYAHAYVKGIDVSLCSASSRCEGEAILTGGIHKKVKKIMCDKKIPSSERSLIPIIREHGEAIYVPLCAVSDKVRATAASHQYVISIYKKQ